MLHVHQKGVGICGVYTYEVAETKVTQTVDYARRISIRCSARWRRVSEEASVRFQSRCSMSMLSRTSRNPSTAHSRWLVSAGTNTPRWSTCAGDDGGRGRNARAQGLRRRYRPTPISKLIDNRLKGIVTQTPSEPLPTAGFSAWSSAPCTCSRPAVEVTGATVLVALFSERDSHAVSFENQ